MDCQSPALALRAMEQSLRECDFERAVLFTDDPAREAARDSRIEVTAIPRIASSADYSRFMVKDLLAHVATDFVQVVQWDGFVTRGEAWTDEFQQYDYIGARWWFHEEGGDVGNGGFSLRSRRLLQALQDPEIVELDPEDDAICRRYRPLLESRHGMRFAPSALAQRYSFEGMDPTGQELGFHRIFNLPYFRDEGALAAMLDPLDDAQFVTPPSVTLVEKLGRLSRRREALRYARRLRASPRYRELPEMFREGVVRLALSAAGRNDPCPCGSGRAFRRCCGALQFWERGG